ncbi:hypothetical protein BJX61DRAFT_549831 [Aspergillus egyptiacus]|nr:hypothetical protein BJX61DRAFT_549831 [Aspergillus egyptiacus]
MAKSTKRQRCSSSQGPIDTTDDPTSTPRRSARVKKIEEFQQRAPLREESSAASLSPPKILDTGPWEALKAQALEVLSRYHPSKGDADAKLFATCHALLEFLPEGGREAIARDIIKAQTDDQLFDTFRNVVTCLLIPVRAAGGRTPTIQSPFSDNQEDEMAERAKLTKSQVRGQQFVDGCFNRDNHKCVISRFLDEEEWEKQGEPIDILYGQLEAAHIIPFSFGKFDKSRASRDRASSIWASIHRYFPSTLPTLRATTIDNLDNGLLLHKTIHNDFGRFECAFQPTASYDTYVFIHYKRFSLEMKQYAPHGTEITFKQAPGYENLPLLNKEYLECHYRLAQIFHASGIDEYIDRNLRRWDKLKEASEGSCLAEDGSSDLTTVLTVALWGTVHC